MPAMDLDVSPDNRPLAEAIVVASRPTHAKLNKLILERLPLAMPPNAPDASLYASGMLHVASIYTTFESIWWDIVNTVRARDVASASANGPNPHGYKDLNLEGQRVPPHVGETLDRLYLPGLMRSERLLADVQSMMGWSADTTKDQLRAIGKTGHLADFVEHIKLAVEKKPHLLLAYSYIMFMALFAGGRVLRSTLKSAGNDFWEKPSSLLSSDANRCPTESQRRNMMPTDAQEARVPNHRNPDPPIRFFQFDTPENGADLKREFKQRFADAEQMLTRHEKCEIVQEGVCIFEHLILLVAQLDSVAIQSRSPTPDRKSSLDSIFAAITRPFTSQVFGGVAVNGEDSGEDSVCRPRHKTASYHGHANVAASSPEESAGGDGPDLSCPKPMRLKKHLTHPARSMGEPERRLTQSTRMATISLRRGGATSWAIWVAIGLLILGFVYSGQSTTVEPHK